MKLLSMIGLQAMLIIVAAAILAFAIKYPDWRDRPPAPVGLFLSLLAGITFSIGFIAWRIRNSGSVSKRAVTAWTVVALLLWWYVVVFLWVNTYGGS